MTHIEASALLGIIEGKSCLTPQPHRIGNGEWVVIVNQVWLSSIADWDREINQWRQFLYGLEQRR